MSTRNITVDIQDNIAIITLRNGKNAININFVNDFNAALDEVISNQQVSGLITTGEGKFYSNGIDLMGFAESSEQERTKFMHAFCKLTARILTFPMPTVAALNGHAFAGGAFLAFSHDYRVMNNFKGWMSINEVHLPSRIPFYLLDLLRCKLAPGHMQTEVISYGKRLTGPAALKLGLVQAIGPGDKLVDKATELVQSCLALGEIDRDALGWMKRDLYETALARLDTEVMPYPISKL